MSNELEKVNFGDTPEKKPLNQAYSIQMPPHNIEAEQGILGCGLICTDGSVMEKCSAAGMTPEYFYKTSHQSLFAAMLALHRRGDLHDDIILLDEIRAQKTEDEVGGIAAIYSLQSKVETTLSSNYYITAVRKEYIARASIRLNREVNERIQAGENLAEVLSEHRQALESLSNSNSSLSAEEIRGISSFKMVSDDDGMVLLGNKYVSRGHMSAIVSSSGMGKSSIILQEAILFALGRDFEGIQPARPLKSLIIQSEDDASDIAEIVTSIYYMLELSDDDKAQADRYVKVVTDTISRGKTFFDKLRGITRFFEPDLVYINPLLAFFDGDITSSRDCGEFFREGLGSLNHPDPKKQWAYIFVHHTNKPMTNNNSKGGRQEAKWNEIMYGMSGSSDIINVCRSIRILHPTEIEGQFVLHLAKRGKRAGIKELPRKADGTVDEMARMVSSTRIYLKHCQERFTPEGYDREIACIFWQPREPDTNEFSNAPAAASKGGRKKIVLTMDDVNRVISRDPAKGITIRQAINMIKEKTTCSASERTVRKRLEELIEEGDLRFNPKGLIYATGAAPVVETISLEVVDDL